MQELIGPLIEKSESNRAQGSSKGEIPLSDSLNYRIAWPAESQKQDANVSDQKLELSKQTLNLTGVDLDNFFSEPNRDVSDRSLERPILSNEVKTSHLEVAAPDNLNLFQNVLPSDPAVNIDAFSGWEAEFQPSASKNQHGGSITSALFISYSLVLERKSRIPNHLILWVPRLVFLPTWNRF